MVNYCILNGVKSNTVKGLLIQSLPAISKPLIRTQIEEIDGRDGDIVTPLGYSAYNKEMTIGLFGDYDIDDVIAFFDSKGQVTFSNEPDKYYNYEIINQIDFERLIRFKKAKVTFHVQPFKYDAVDQSISKSNQLLGLNDWTLTKNGVTLTVSSGEITVNGTASTATEFYVPINRLTLEAGDYTLNAYAEGDNAESVALRLILDSPSNANSFGGIPVWLENGNTVDIEATLTAEKQYTYLWFYVLSGVAIDITLSVDVVSGDFSSITVYNRGNTGSKPKVTIYGIGVVNLSLNGIEVFAVDIGNAGYITIDVAGMNAYHDGTFMNRQVTGDYDNLILNKGTNIISWTGNVTEITVENYSRWI